LVGLGLACAALAQLDGSDDPVEPEGLRRDSAQAEEATGPMLLGAEARGAPRRAERAGAESAGSAAGTSPAPEARALAPAPAASEGSETAALCPSMVEDRVRPEAPRPLWVPRSDLLGTVGAYGHRDGPQGFDPRWVGAAMVARAERTGPEAPDDTTDPVSTAVIGRVLRQDGTAVPGAEVILYTSFYLRQVYYDRRVREIGRVYTDGEGRFDLRPVDLDTVHFGRSGEVLVTVRHPNLPDLVAQPLEGLTPGRETDVGALALPEVGLVVWGTILDLAGAPVAGATVRASGLMNPVDYDKTERMIVLSGCPAAVTDARGRYRLTDVAPGRHELSVHVHLDCVWHEAGTWEGEREWSPRVRAGHGVLGRVVDGDGQPLAAAVVRGGGNWTPTYADGTFWLDNVDPGPLLVDVSHHDFARHVFAGVQTDLEEPITLALTRRLARVTLEVTDATGSPVPLVEIAWTWAPGRGPDEFTPRSPRWHNPRGTFALVVPDGVVGASVTREGVGAGTLAESDLLDGRAVRLVLVPAVAPTEEVPASR
jgi:hypothetical protein